AEVVDETTSRILHRLQGGDVAGGQVDDVDEVANARAVDRRIVVAIHREAVELARRDLGDIGHQVGRSACGIFPYQPARVGADRVEVAEKGNAPSVVGSM